MKLHQVSIGERYGDDSGWERRVVLDLQEGLLEITIHASTLRVHPREIEWIMAALKKAQEATYG